MKFRTSRLFNVGAICDSLYAKLRLFILYKGFQSLCVTEASNPSVTLYWTL